MKWRVVLAAFAAFLVGSVAVGCNQKLPIKPYKKKADLAYGPDPAHRFDVYEPIEMYAKHKRHHPVVFVIHGGSWYIGDKEQLGKQVARELCPEGYAVVSINYRLAPDHVWPAQLEDVQAALAYVTSASFLHIDRNRLAVLGHSAGAMLASHLALRGDGNTRPYVSTAVLLAGHYAYDSVTNDILPPHVAQLITGSMEGTPSPEAVREVSSVHLARREVGALLLHPTFDPSASVEHSERMYRALLEAGSQGSDFKYVNSGDHNNFWLKDDGSSVGAIVRFLDRRL